MDSGMIAELFALIAESDGEKEVAVSLRALSAFKDVQKLLIKTASVYTKPAETPTENHERQKALFSQRSAFIELMNRIEGEVRGFVDSNPIPDDILYQIEKEI